MGSDGVTNAGRPDMQDPEVRRKLFTTMPTRGTFSCKCEHAHAATHDLCFEDDESWHWTPENKPRSWELYDFFGKPKTVVAPMVDQSELSFRLLCKRYGADLTYTPMVNSNCFVKDTAQQYRLREYSTCPADTNQMLQFCGNNPETIVEAAKIVERSGCKAIDLNLGCPQGIARKGHYGAFLMEDWGLIRSMIEALDRHISIPITAKIRVFHDPQHTLEYARMIEAAGATMLGVHGRVREAKGSVPGDASWTQIRNVKEALSIPVIANGNIWSYEDVALSLEQTKCDAVMSADTLLWEPRLFANPLRSMHSGRHFQIIDPVARLEAIETCLEYLDICETHPTQANQMKTHIFKMTHHSLQIFTNVRQMISDASSGGAPGGMLPVFRELVLKLKSLEEELLASKPTQPVRTREEHLKTVQHLGNVDVPSRHVMSHMCAEPDLDSEYRRKKDEKIENMLEEEPAFTLFDS